MKTVSRLLLALALIAIGGVLGTFAIAQGGMQRLANFGTQTNVTGIGQPCTVSCYFTLSQGTVTLNGATGVAVANTLVTANSVIIFTLKSVNSGTVSPNAPNVLTITPGTGFTVGGTASDVGIYNYVIVN